MKSLFVFSWLEFYKNITATLIFLLNLVFRGKESGESEEPPQGWLSLGDTPSKIVWALGFKGTMGTAGAIMVAKQLDR